MATRKEHLLLGSTGPGPLTYDMPLQETSYWDDPLTDWGQTSSGDSTAYWDDPLTDWGASPVQTPQRVEQPYYNEVSFGGDRSYSPSLGAYFDIEDSINRVASLVQPAVQTGGSIEDVAREQMRQPVQRVAPSTSRTGAAPSTSRTSASAIQLYPAIQTQTTTSRWKAPGPMPEPGELPELDLPEWDERRVRALAQQIAGPALMRQRRDLMTAMVQSGRYFGNPLARAEATRRALQAYGIGVAETVGRATQAAGAEYSRERADEIAERTANYQAQLQDRQIRYQAALQDYMKRGETVSESTSETQYQRFYQGGMQPVQTWGSYSWEKQRREANQPPFFTW